MTEKELFEKIFFLTTYLKSLDSMISSTDNEKEHEALLIKKNNISHELEITITTLNLSTNTHKIKNKVIDIIIQMSNYLSESKQEFTKTQCHFSIERYQDIIYTKIKNTITNYPIDENLNYFLKAEAQGIYMINKKETCAFLNNELEILNRLKVKNHKDLLDYLNNFNYRLRKL